MEWGKVALYALCVVGVAATMLALSALVTRWLGPRQKRREKLEPYECGVPIQSPTRQRFSVHFYLVAILFILFDIEMVFLVPWAVLFRKLGVAGLIEMGLFLGVIGFGLAYVWRRGALNWE
ncbi:MAG: NADH-quinone oxidoreductase subunit A [Planctomycetes bacterium]|nr:NADH-quinone oxidoreductase subunit A [Planctomycetota bacterium]